VQDSEAEFPVLPTYNNTVRLYYGTTCLKGLPVILHSHRLTSTYTNEVIAVITIAMIIFACKGGLLAVMGYENKQIKNNSDGTSSKALVKPKKAKSGPNIMRP
jgi:hypothetical protein